METSDKPSHSFRKKLKITVFCAVIALIWAVWSLPTIFYHLQDSAEDAPTSSTMSSMNDADNDIFTNETLLNSSNSQCFPEVYGGSVCRSALQSLQNCIPNLCNSTEIYISPDRMQNEVEAELASLLGGLQLLSPSPTCLAAVVPFLCFYYFGLCDSGELYQPSFEDCATIASETCRVEFQAAINLGLGRDRLPQCELLSDSSDSSSELAVGCSDQCSAGLEDMDDANFPSCSDGFYLVVVNGTAGSCQPECATWEELPHHVIAVGDAFAISQAVVYIISAGVLLVIACIEHKRMFKFPAIFIIYEMIPLGLLSVFILIGQMDRTQLFCSAQNLLESLDNSTFFCNLQGAVLYYIALQQALLWNFHTAAVLWTIKFPLAAKSFEAKNYTKYVHLMMLALAITLPFICVIVVFATGGCRLSRFPNIICLARKPDVTFYAFVLPLSFLTAAGMSMIATIFWILYHITRDMATMQRKKQDSEKRRTGSLKKTLSSLKRHTAVNKSELKILILLIYFSILLAGIITSFTLRLTGINSLITDVGTYFSCEARGNVPGQEACDRSFERLGSEILSVFSYLLIGFYPIVSLIYVVNVQELKQKVLILLGRGGRTRVASNSFSSSLGKIKAGSVSA